MSLAKGYISVIWVVKFSFKAWEVNELHSTQLEKSISKFEIQSFTTSNEFVTTRSDVFGILIKVSD